MNVPINAKRLRGLAARRAPSSMEVGQRFRSFPGTKLDNRLSRWWTTLSTALHPLDGPLTDGPPRNTIPRCTVDEGVIRRHPVLDGPRGRCRSGTRPILCSP